MAERNTLVIAALRRDATPRAFQLEKKLLLGASCVAGLSALWFLLLAGRFNLICALMIGSILLLALIRDAIAAALLTLTYLHVLGDTRRLLDAAVGIPQLDLLLLVAPCMAALLVAPVVLRLRVHDALSKAMLAMTVLMMLEIINPAQGALAIGASGALFYLVPVLWFWIGRRIGSPAVIERLLYHIIFPLAALAAVLGLWQTLVGFFPYEQAWIDATLKNYTALSLGGTTRPFGFSVSAAEYATLLELGAAGVAAAVVTKRKVWVVVFPLLISAMLLSSVRSVVVKLIVALAVVWALRKKQAMSTAVLLRIGALLMFGLIGVSYLASLWPSAGESLATGSATQESLAHLSGGLAHPFDRRYSTASIHQGMFLRAIGASFASPLGHGLGATTGAAAKFADSSDQYSSEIDISDMFIIMGPVGGLVYLFIFGVALRSALLYLQRTKLSIALPVLAILIATVGAWLISGQYSTSALIFFLIGGTNYTSAEQEKQDAATELSRPHAAFALAR